MDLTQFFLPISLFRVNHLKLNVKCPNCFLCIVIFNEITNMNIFISPTDNVLQVIILKDKSKSNIFSQFHKATSILQGFRHKQCIFLLYGSKSNQKQILFDGLWGFWKGPASLHGPILQTFEAPNFCNLTGLHALIFYKIGPKSFPKKYLHRRI